MNLHDINLMSYRQSRGETNDNDLNIDGLKDNNIRLELAGGKRQQDRMIKGKRQTLSRVIQSSYTSAKIQKIEDDKVWRGLITPNRYINDYDEKILSIGFQAEMAIGDVFTWQNTNTQWLIYSQELTELAYFRGKIRRCKYEIIADNRRIYATLRGPDEKGIQTSVRHGIQVDYPNYTLELIIQNTPENRAFFKRYQTFYLKDNPTLWRVEAVDSITSMELMEVYVGEYYSNPQEEARKNAEVIPEITAIIGEDTISPTLTYTYTIQGETDGEWGFDDTKNLKIISQDDKSITLVWTKLSGGALQISYGDQIKYIKIKSLY